MPRTALGSGVTLAFEVYQPDGVTPLDATNPVVTLRRPTLPDVTYSAGAVVRDDVGKYHVAVPKTDVAELGHYAWSASADSPQGVLAGRTLDVIDPFAPALITLADARSALGKTTRNVDVDELQLHVDTANERIDTMTGPAVPRTVTDTGVSQWSPHQHYSRHVSGEGRGAGRIQLTRPPGPGPGSFLTLLSATLAAAAVDITQWQTAGGTVTAGYGFYLPPNTAYTVIYRVGRQPIPAPLFLAARILVQHLWQTQRAQTSGAATDGGADLVSTGYGFAIPNRVAELVRPYEFGPGIA